jgi:hypothetical protein
MDSRTVSTGSPNRLRSFDPVRIARLEHRAYWPAHLGDATLGSLHAGLVKLNDLLRPSRPGRQPPHLLRSTSPIPGSGASEPDDARGRPPSRPPPVAHLSWPEPPRLTPGSPGRSRGA